MVKRLRVSRVSPVFCLFLILVAHELRATDFYVSPTASSNGTGSFSNPWQLDTALNQPSAVHAGDTIWLRGGTYTGTHTSLLSGSASSPIIVRQYPGERATLDGGGPGQTYTTLSVAGKYTWYWGFEIMSSDTRRQSAQPGSSPTDIYRPDGIQIVQNSSTGSGLKFINLTIHDARQGISYWKEAVDSEVSGCLIYYNGWDAPDRGHGHGIYTQNQTGTKRMVDNIIFQQFGGGIQAYGSSAAFLNNFWAEGNTNFENGSLSNMGASDNLLVGGFVVTNNDTILSNMLYFNAVGDIPTAAFHYGYTTGCTNGTVTGNYVAANSDLSNCAPVSMTGNTYYGTIDGFSPGQYPNNTYLSARPTGTKVFVRPNQYEAGRANITIFNWNLNNSVSVDLSAVLPVGTGYEIRNANDFFGAPVTSGTYAGGSVTIPMTGLSVAAPVGWSAPAPLGPEFGVFVLLPASPAGTPTPTAPPTSTRTPTVVATKTPTPPSTPTRTPTGPAATPTRTPTPGGGLQAPWLQQDIGAVGLPGSASASSGIFTVNASGTDIEDTSDQFRYVYQTLSGDGTLLARVTSIQNTNPWAKGGVMIRESLAANSSQAMMVLTPGNGVAFQRRKTTGGVTFHTGGASVVAPYWVKIVRSGSTFSGYSSPDGVNWSLVGSDTISMATNVYFGLALTSHNNAVLCTAKFDSVNASAGSALRIEAESPVLTAPMASAASSGAFGGQFIATSVANAGTGSWAFSVPAAATYYVWGRVLSANDQQDSFFVKMDSGSEDVYDTAQGTWSPNWQWTRLNGRGSSGVPLSINPRSFSLSSGSHTLTFRGREAGTRLDRILLTTDPLFVPTEAP